MARLRLIEGVGVHTPTLLRTEEPGTAEVVAVLSQAGSGAAILIDDASARSLSAV